MNIIKEFDKSFGNSSFWVEGENYPHNYNSIRKFIKENIIPELNYAFEAGRMRLWSSYEEWQKALEKVKPTDESTKKINTTKDTATIKEEAVEEIKKQLEMTILLQEKLENDGKEPRDWYELLRAFIKYNIVEQYLKEGKSDERSKE